jgi:hypothetical protein
MNAISFEMTWMWIILANARSAYPSAVVFLLDVISKFPGPATRLPGSLRERPAWGMPPERTFVLFIACGRGPQSREGVEVERVGYSVGQGVDSAADPKPLSEMSKQESGEVMVK